MSTTTRPAETGDRVQIDPRGPRFAATLTTLVLAVALVVTPSPATVVLVAVQVVVFAIGAVAGIQHTPYSWLFKTLVRPRLGKPAELEDAAPPRFAQAVGLGFGLVALLGYALGADLLGMLDAQAWRASRLITDSGMHGLGWSRQRSIDWLLKTGLSETDAIIETDRYIAWPGQALTYMVGMREIRRLRQALEARDGDRFDLTGFHDQLIGHGSLPLVTLAAELPGWVKPSA